MLHYRHKFHMCITHLLNIFNQHRCDFSVIIKFPSIIRLFPGTNMHFINSNRCILFLNLFPSFHPGFIMPFKLSKVCNHGCICRTKFRCIRIRISFQISKTVPKFQFIFINRPHRNLRNKQFKNSGYRKLVHLICSSVPMIKITYHTDSHGIWCPYSEVYTIYTINSHRVSSKFFIDIITDSIGKLLFVINGKLRRECICIIILSDFIPFFYQINIFRYLFSLKKISEKACFIFLNHRIRFTITQSLNTYFLFIREKTLNQYPFIRYSRSENCSWRAFFRINNCFNLRPIHQFI